VQQPSGFLEDVLAQPGVVADTAARLSRVRGLGSLSLPLASGRRVVLTGMGASLFALQPLLYELFDAGVGAVLVEAGELVHHGRALLADGTLVVAVSQSGRSAEIVRLLDVCGSGVTVVGVTNDATSPLGARAAHVVETHAGVESAVSSKTYVATLAALRWLGALLTGRALEEAAADLEAAAGAMRSYLAAADAHLPALRAALVGVRQVYAVGRGPSVAAAMTAGLVIKEGARFPAEGMPAASFRHGPIEVVGPDVFVLAYEGRASTAALGRRLVDDVRAAGGRAELCGPGAEAGPFRLPSVPDGALPFVEILPAQLMIVALGEIAGRPATGKLGIAAKVTERE
jgi:glucosamine--fructose-6-phosphate aminotransferase (isomerizing)